jgi:hypothetical protein
MKKGLYTAKSRDSVRRASSCNEARIRRREEDRCNSSGATVDTRRNPTAYRRRAERAADGQRAGLKTKRTGTEAVLPAIPHSFPLCPRDLPLGT